MSEDILDDLNMVFITEKRQFIYQGLYPCHKYTIFYTIRTIILYFFSATLVITMMIQLAIGVNEVSEATDILYYMPTLATYNWKLTNFVIGRGKLLIMEEHLKHPVIYKYLRKFGATFLKDAVHFCSLTALTFRVLLGILVVFYGVYPLFDKNSGKKLPFSGWYPIDKDKFQAPLYVLQLICLFVCVITNSSIDILTAKKISVAAALLKTLKQCLREIDYTDTEGSDIVSADLGIIVFLHEHILDYIIMIEDMFSYGIFIQFLTSIAVICLTGFQMLVVPAKSAEFISLISYLACVMCQVAMYCWFGNQILTESDDIGTACYMSNWYEGTTKAKKVLFMIMERSKRELKLTAGKLFTLSLATLVLVLKSSYSYFAVLRRLYNE